MHHESVLEATESAGSNVLVTRYVCELSQGITALGNAAAGGDSLLSSTLENMLTQLVSINERLGRLEDAHTRLPLGSGDAPPPAASASFTTAVELSAPSPTTASTLEGSLLNGYTNHIWESVKALKASGAVVDAYPQLSASPLSATLSLSAAATATTPLLTPCWPHSCLRRSAAVSLSAVLPRAPRVRRAAVRRAAARTPSPPRRCLSCCRARAVAVVPPPAHVCVLSVELSVVLRAPRRVATSKNAE
ncbi:hypothetical protein PHYSODRAFT_249732 [Phytophthora sojae]|uniref:Uncharacterized protein n=1 Tax=Phytophthora sojae (strain P6497) TaxID=1094619 RepID=G4ZPL8_PHYSP|nr:hypothetical protein PHYSODRAFT_249732 [Phytophthora sojae]EGZ16330.1 hypothetical protein PHYSODRAFT_249732 [Phytophthora sojae]|eukprot:XP_009530079.1 hypothetical protein PHYSODRAFT_249732 [Phytophthora sojae]